MFKVLGAGDVAARANALGSSWQCKQSKTRTKNMITDWVLDKLDSFAVILIGPPRFMERRSDVKCRRRKTYMQGRSRLCLFKE